MTDRRRPQPAALWLATTALLLGLSVPVPALAADPEPVASPSAVPAEPTVPATAAPVDLPSAVTLEGLLRVTPIEPEPRHATDPATPMPSGKVVTLHTPEGTSVELTGAAVADAHSGERFRGTVRVDQAVATVIERKAAERPVPQEAAELGELVADVSVALDKPLRVVKATTASVVQPAVAAKAHTVDIMYVHAAGTSAPSAAAVDAMVARLGEFWKSESNGQISGITRPGATKTVTLPESQLCNPDWLWQYAAGPAGFNRTPVIEGAPETYYWAGSKAAHLIVISPSGPCTYGVGLGTIGSIHSGGMVWASVTFDPLDWDGTVFHEVGHNLGLEHSNVTVCQAPAVDGPACEMWTYEDYYDVMGGGFTYGEHTNTRNVPALNVTHKVRLDALPRGSALREVRTTGGTKQEFTLTPASGKTGIRGLEIVDPLNQDKLYVEYRSGTGRDAESFYTKYSAAYPSDPTYAPGVRVLKIVSGESSVLPRWAGNTLALSYRAGDDFLSRSRDSAGEAGVRVSVVSTSPTGATVRVSFDSESLSPSDPPVESQAPTISGTPRIGVTLTAKPGEWTPGAVFSYQWMVAGRDVTGARSRTFVPRKSDLGSVVAVRVTGTAAGYSSVTRTSATTAKVLPLRKLKTKQPSISGTPRIGVTLTAKPGKWTSGTLFTYQWLVSGKAVKGATAATFVPRKSDKGKRVTVRITGTNPGYATATTTSKKSSKVRPLRSMKKATPTVSGTVKVGMTLTAKPGKWTAGARLAYQWLVGGKAVAGATARTFVPRETDRGRTITVKVTGTKAGYKTTSKTSKATGKVS